MDKDDADEHFESSAFEALEKDFQEVLQELIGDKSLEHFRLEYEKLHRALKKSHESEKRLIKKCRELNQEIVSNATKVQTALNLSKEDQLTIQNLKKEIERAWKMVEASHEKEQRAKETIHNLKAEINNLSHLVEQGAGLSVNQENTVNSLITQRDELLRTRDKLETQVAKMTQENINLTETVQKHESEKLQGEVEIANLRDMLNAKRTEAERELRRRQRLEKELQELKQTLNNKDRSLRSILTGIKEQEEQKKSLDASLMEQQRLVEQMNLEEQKLQRDIKELMETNKSDEAERKNLHEGNLELGKELKAKAEELKVSQQEKDKTQKQFDKLKRTKALEDEERHQLELSRGVLKSDTENLIREIDQLRKQVDLDSKNINEIMRDRKSVV